MKLAEALQERADINRQIARLNARLAANAVTQEGEAPAEDPAELLKRLDGCLARLEALMARINLVNSETIVNGRTLTEMIARRDCLRAHRFLSEAHRRGQSGLTAHGAFGNTHCARGGRARPAKGRGYVQRRRAPSGQ